MAGLWYRSGTISVTNASKKVVGSGTLFKTSTYKPDKGHTFWGPDGKHYEVDYVESDTALYLVQAYSGATASGQSYEIDITRTSTIPALSREISAQLAYAQGQYDAWQKILTGLGDVTLTAPDGQTITVPALDNMLSKTGNLDGLAAPDTALSNLGMTSVGKAVAKATDAAAARVALGAVANSYTENSMYYWGVFSDAKPGLLLICKKYAGSGLAKQGFVGRVILSRGGTTSSNFESYADVKITAGYITNTVSLVELHVTGAQISIVEVTYNSEIWYAIYSATGSSRTVTTVGKFYSQPILISDATVYPVTQVAQIPENFSSRYKPTAADVNAYSKTEMPYEPGTFTPVIVGVTTVGVGTYTLQYGYYTRIGNRVFVDILLSWNAHTGTGGMRIGGMPFVAGSVPISFQFSVYHNFISAALPVSALLGGGSSQVLLRSLDNGGAYTDVLMDSSGEIRISGSYQI
jgi:hypothetical protein